MNYIQELADKIHQQIPQELLPDAENINELMLIYAVLAVAKGKNLTNEDVHNAWAAWMSFSDPNHRSIVDYAALSLDVKEQDAPFTEAIRRTIS